MAGEILLDGQGPESTTPVIVPCPAQPLSIESIGTSGLNLCGPGKQEIERLFALQTRIETGNAALLLEPRPDGRRRPAAPLRIALHLSVDFLVRRGDLLPPGDLVQRQRTPHRLRRGVAL